MFIELSLFHPDMGIGSPGEARGWASKSLPSLPPTVYNRHEDGRTLSSPCPFTVYPNRGGVRICAVGRAAVSSLIAIVPKLQTEFSSVSPGGQLDMRMGSVRVATQPYLASARVEGLVIQNRNSDVHKEWAAGRLPPEEITRLAEAEFRRRLEERASIAEVELPEDAMFGDFAAEATRPAYAGEQPLFAVDLSFRTNLKFEGPWFIGHLASKGSGRIHRNRNTP